MQDYLWQSNLFTPNQDVILQNLSENLTSDGLYYLPSTAPESPEHEKEHQERMKANVGKPWVMIFYHKAMENMSPVYILRGLLYTLISCLLVSLILFYGNFTTFTLRLLVSMAFALFALTQGVLDELNWWSYPWSFIKPQVIDLTLGWGLCSVWLGWYVHK
jgi:hypothetical protein